MLPDYISNLFAEAHNKFDPITGQTTDSHLAKLREVLSQILLIVPHNNKNGVHNLVGLIQYPTTYTSDYITASPPTMQA